MDFQRRDRWLETGATTLGPDVKTFLNHYAAMLRRYIMSDSEIEQLCRKIYQAHRHALDRIFEYLPDTQELIRTYCRELIKETERNVGEGGIALDIDLESKGYMKFFPKVWDTIPALREGRGWTSSGRILLFQFENVARWLRVKLYLGPGPNALRQKIFQIAKEKGNPFKPSQKTPGLKWVAIYTNIFLKTSDIEGAAEEDIKEKIRKHWDKFISGDLPVIVDAVKNGMAK